MSPRARVHRSVSVSLLGDGAFSARADRRAERPPPARRGHSVAALLRPAAERYGRRSRERKWTRFQQLFRPAPDMRVLDLGVSPLDHLPNENYFLRRYPHPEGLTAVGVSDLTALKERYPGVRFVQADGRSLPFATGEFDVVHCNAVVEHVGDGGDQARFIGELVRVARAGFVTTPNRWFPIESHTRLPLFHWLPRPAALAALRGLGQLERGQEWPVWLLSRAEFARLFPPSVETWVGSQRLLGVCATVSVAFWHWEESLSS